MLIKQIDNNYKILKEKPFKLEKDIQKFVEENMNMLLGYTFIASEFSVESFRFDSVVFDPETKSFIIIEYKKSQNYSVVDQGYSYLGTMLKNKAEFILTYNEIFNTQLKKDAVDWSQSKIIFISTEFTKYQKNALMLNDIPIELYEIKRYENNMIHFNKLLNDKANESIKSVRSKNPIIENVSKEIKIYSLDDHFLNGNEKTIELYEKLSEKIQEMISDIIIEPKKLYIAFKKNNKNILDIKLQRNQIKLWLNIEFGLLKDDRNLIRNVEHIGHHGNGQCEITIENDDNLEIILSLIKEAYIIIDK